jgi:hypothetical protein
MRNVHFAWFFLLSFGTLLGQDFHIQLPDSLENQTIILSHQEMQMTLMVDTNDTRKTLDSIYIEEVEKKYPLPKILHAEPLYIDLIRDLGARKGENEWNVGFGLTDKERYSAYEALVEYEWAPIDRLGLEIEVPVTIYQPRFRDQDDSDSRIPDSRINSLKLAAQWSFLVSEKYKTTLALGYLHEFELTPFVNYGRSQLYSGNLYNPFFIAAKRWGMNYHTLIYAGPVVEHYFGQDVEVVGQINTNLHYMITGTRNFIGVEFNKEIIRGRFEMVMRPQMRLGITDDLLIGIVAGIPVNRQMERMSFFTRLIYEPPHRQPKAPH